MKGYFLFMIHLFFLTCLQTYSHEFADFSGRPNSKMLGMIEKFNQDNRPVFEGLYLNLVNTIDLRIDKAAPDSMEYADLKSLRISVVALSEYYLHNPKIKRSNPSFLAKHFENLYHLLQSEGGLIIQEWGQSLLMGLHYQLFHRPSFISVISSPLAVSGILVTTGAFSAITEIDIFGWPTPLGVSAGALFCGGTLLAACYNLFQSVLENNDGYYQEAQSRFHQLLESNSSTNNCSASVSELVR